MTTMVDLHQLTNSQQQMWASGDFSVVAPITQLAAERLAETAKVRPGWMVLDVATGSGNAALAAARHGSEVWGVDYVESVLEHGRARAKVEGLDVSFMEGDAQHLPFADCTFDAVLSVYGAMFAPDQEGTAAELVRVTAPGGTIALANWTPDSFIADVFRVIAGFLPAPAGVPVPFVWGSQSGLAGLFGGSVRNLRTRRQRLMLRFRSPDHFVEFFATWYGPTLRAFQALERDERAELHMELAQLARRADVLGDGQTIAIPATYLEAVAVRA